MILEARFAADVERSLRYLDSAEARAALALDPYWPKWDSPWWHAALLVEMGHVERLPRSFVDAFARALDTHYSHELPGPDGMHELCHCALGTAYKILFAAGFDVDAALPWVRPWFLRYQQPDGGLNCASESKKSSLVSTLPPLEAILLCTTRALTPEEERFVDAGAAYLIARKLHCKAGTDVAIDAEWLKPCFPRFYHYDVLRGLTWLTEWASRRGRPLPEAATSAAVAALQRNAGDLQQIKPRRVSYAGEGSLLPAAGGTWEKGPARVFDLQAAVSVVNRPSPWLTREWDATRRRLAALSEGGPKPA